MKEAIIYHSLFFCDSHSDDEIKSFCPNAECILKLEGDIEDLDGNIGCALCCKANTGIRRGEKMKSTIKDLDWGSYGLSKFLERIEDIENRLGDMQRSCENSSRETWERIREVEIKFEMEIEKLKENIRRVVRYNEA